MRTSRTRRTHGSNSPLIITSAIINLVFLMTLIAFSYLREQPLFWTNAGNFPIWLRDLVDSTYYPLFVLELLLLTAFSGLSIHLLSSGSRSASLTVIMLPMLWGLFLTIIVNSVANNLENLLAGRPLHWHADAFWQQRP